MINVRVFDGRAFKVEKHNILRDATVAFPNGSLLLASEIVDNDPPAVEVWIAVPLEELPVSHPTPAAPVPLRKVEIPPGEQAWPLEEEEDYEVTVEIDGEPEVHEDE